MGKEKLKRINGKARTIILLGFDILCFLVVSLAYFLLADVITSKSDFRFTNYLINAGVITVAIVAVQFIMGMNRNVWRYPHTQAYLYLVISFLIVGLFSFTLAKLLSVFNVIDFYLGVWYYVSVLPISALLCLSGRFCYRLIYKKINASKGKAKQYINVAIVGAGQLGVSLANDLLNNPKAFYKPIFFVDSDSAKINHRVCGLPVFSQKDNILDYIELYAIKEIFIAIKNISGERTAQMYNEYVKTGCKVKIYDSPIQSEAPSKRIIRDFEIEDLLFRDPLTINDEKTQAYYTDKTILVTGGGGSIGSELCRQIAKCNPKRLIIFDIYENNAYNIQQELINRYGKDISLSVEIGSVRDRVRLEGLFSNYKPNIVFHAAAHKHVPLMEQSGAEAIKNNVFGTFNTADMAEKYGVEKFILVSTDKAVNPTNIMGASKRLCEMVVQCRTDSKTNFAAVRFGNVLGSNGSVIPLFKSQIAKGGPITITDKRIIRYFMTIPEASQLVMQAGAMAKKGELFVLDMGKPVKIYDLAVNLIKLSGLEPDKDIEIKEVGLRPGEKLYEELLMKSETLDKTLNDLIYIERDKPLSRAEMNAKLEILKKAVEESAMDIGSEKIKEAVIATVPTYHQPEEINSKIKGYDVAKSVGQVG